MAAVRLPDSRFDQRDPFGELRSLAEQAGAIIVGELSQRLERPVPATYMGSGKVTELKNLCEELDAKTIIFDHDLSPKQISNIEKETGRKVVDRSELILDIFASRAVTREAQLQVELAQLEYTFPRLKAMWDHLERIVGHGGIGGIGTRGPGEQQLEIDRRLVQRRKLALEGELKEIQARRRREVQSRKREHFTVGIVGYTNAGKSTLFNTLTAGGAYADDRLFATLMTRTREWIMGPEVSMMPGEADGQTGGQVRVMLSDTVGFVRDIPTHLVASFKATLEEATHADLLLVMLDVSDPAAELQYQAVTETLDELMKKTAEEEVRATDGKSRWTPPPRILLLNKSDRLRENTELLVWKRKDPSAIPICALTKPAGSKIDVECEIPYGLGHRELCAIVRAAAQGDVDTFDVTVPMADGKTVHFIETRGTVQAREYNGDAVTLRARIGKRQLAYLRSQGARLNLATTTGEIVQLEPDPGEVGRPGWKTSTESQ